LQHLGHAHHHAGVHSADDHIDLVALHQLVDVFRRLGGIGLVVHGDEFDFAPGEFAAALIDRQLEAVGDGHAKLGEGAGVGQHQADLELGLLRQGHGRRQQRADSGGTGDGGGTLQEAAAGKTLSFLLMCLLLSYVCGLSPAISKRA
jgi:hypothetical protein